MDKKSEKQQLKDWKTFRIDENLNFQIEEQQQYQIRFKKKKNYTKTYHSKTTKHQRQRDDLKSSQKEKRKLVCIGTIIRLMSDFSKTTTEAKRQ